MSCDRRPQTQRGALGALLALGVAGCTTVVVPPARVVEPAQVALLDHGRHASLVLETAEGGMVRYPYGDWMPAGRPGPGVTPPPATRDQAAVCGRAARDDNSDQVVGDWLEQLGCRLEGPIVLSNWQHGNAQSALNEARSKDAGRHPQSGRAPTSAGAETMTGP